MSRFSKTGFGLACVVLGMACAPDKTADVSLVWDPTAPAPLDTLQSPASGLDAGSGGAVPSTLDAGGGSGRDAGTGQALDAGGNQVPEPPAPVDAGTEPGPDFTDDPAFTGATVCSSGTYYRAPWGEDEGSELMDPGQACITCHKQEREGPSYSIAGTVYLTGHEPDDCNGVNGGDDGVQVELLDALGKLVRLTPNPAGNFFSADAFAFPVTAKVLYQGRERAMDGEINAADGDCNSCHTSDGREGAPGRIALP